MVSLEHRYAIGMKRLRDVEVTHASRQHELNGVAALQAVLGRERIEGLDMEWVLLRDDGNHMTEIHRMTWYDSRENQPDRSPEWRLYYRGDTTAQPGDVVVLIRRDDSEMRVVVAASGSTWESQIEHLLGGSAAPEQGFAEGTLSELPEAFVGVFAELAETLGWEEQPEPDIAVDIVDEAFDRFGGTFPATRILSGFAREKSREERDPDVQLEEWWQVEDNLFRGLERRIVESRIAKGFADVNDFLSFSLTVQNRRKSRAGYAFENHLEALLIRHQIQFTRGGRTEGNRTPDFLFPGIDAYRDPGFPSGQLRMLGAKTTCKERWRQILSEAARIPLKHLCTLEPAISPNQLAEMAEEHVVLVAPARVRATYQIPPTTEVVRLSEFIAAAHAIPQA